MSALGNGTKPGGNAMLRKALTFTEKDGGAHEEGYKNSKFDAEYISDQE